MTNSTQLGIRPNLGQFALLVLTNGFVGAMVGVERTVMPELAKQDFDLASKSAAVAFLISFGLSKALGNLAAGRLADRWPRKRVLVIGWLFGIPAPLLVIFAPSWGWVVAANVLLGINQALCWSVTVIMKIDLAGPKRRGVATAANEWAGYLGIAVMAFATGYLATHFSPRPAPFYVGLGIAVVGLLLSVLFVRSTEAHVKEESGDGEPEDDSGSPTFGEVFWRTTWRDRSLGAASQAGLATNLKDGLMWGLTPVLLRSHDVSLDQVGIVAAVYPAVWGFCQLASGPLSDRWGRKWMIVAGLIIQAVGVAGFALGATLWQWIAAAVVIGVGTAAVYPTLLAAVSDVADPQWRASGLGVYRLWRDSGYALAGAAVGPLADALGTTATFHIVAALVLASGFAVAVWMRETNPRNDDS